MDTPIFKKRIPKHELYKNPLPISVDEFPMRSGQTPISRTRPNNSKAQVNRLDLNKPTTAFALYPILVTKPVSSTTRLICSSCLGFLAYLHESRLFRSARKLVQSWLELLLGWNMHGKKRPRRRYRGVLSGSCIWLVNDGGVRDSELVDPLRQTAMGLWRGGFFGKGTLSRGEPDWTRRWARNKNKKTEVEPIKSTSDTAPGQTGMDKGNTNAVEAEASSFDPERYQLSAEESFFLSWALECLDVCDDAGNIITSKRLWDIYRLNSVTRAQRLKSPSDLSWQSFANPFIIRYVAYHHYRSQGWVVRSGIKFGADFGKH
ncbi:tRNA splicing endonuclease subunit sen2 [Quaeritorhiza haematococci]|nr:tRNA splicing endonuclease subunit sen2 [Quaeritorhiza haematococci]